MHQIIHLNLEQKIVEINGKARGTYISKSQIKFEISV